jgi:hypothetical protein
MNVMIEFDDLKNENGTNASCEGLFTQKNPRTLPQKIHKNPPKNPQNKKKSKKS